MTLGGIIFILCKGNQELKFLEVLIMLIANSLMNIFVDDKEKERIKDEIALGKMDVKDILFKN